jgi:hypothetical protein
MFPTRNGHAFAATLALATSVVAACGGGELGGVAAPGAGGVGGQAADAPAGGGGAGAPGGATGAAGATNVGGASGAAGAAGASGAAGAAGSPVPVAVTPAVLDVDSVVVRRGADVVPDFDFQFGAAEQVAATFRVNQYACTPQALCQGGVTLGFSADGEDGGSMRVSAPFTALRQIVESSHPVSLVLCDNLRDLTRTVATARVKLVSGGSTDPACPAAAWLFVTTTRSGPPAVCSYELDYLGAHPPPTPLKRGEWVELTFDLSTDPAFLSDGWDPTVVNQVGIQYLTSCDSLVSTF